MVDRTSMRMYLCPGVHAVHLEVDTDSTAETLVKLFCKYAASSGCQYSHVGQSYQLRDEF